MIPARRIDVITPHRRHLFGSTRRDRRVILHFAGRNRFMCRRWILRILLRDGFGAAVPLSVRAHWRCKQRLQHTCRGLMRHPDSGCGLLPCNGNSRENSRAALEVLSFAPDREALSRLARNPEYPSGN